MTRLSNTARSPPLPPGIELTDGLARHQYRTIWHRVGRSPRGGCHAGPVPCSTAAGAVQLLGSLSPTFPPESRQQVAGSLTVFAMHLSYASMSHSGSAVAVAAGPRAMAATDRPAVMRRRRLM